MAVAENHATLPQKTDLTIPMQYHRSPMDKVGPWDCHGAPQDGRRMKQSLSTSMTSPVVNRWSNASSVSSSAMLEERV